MPENVVRKRIKEMLSSPGIGWQSTGDLSTAPVSVSSVVDPSASKTDPGNFNHVPTNRMELRAVVSNMIDDISDDDVVEFYSSFRDVIHSNEEKDDKEKKMTRNKNVEESIRRSIRRMLNEAGPYRDTGMSYSGPMTDTPAPRAGMQTCEACDGSGDTEDGVSDCPTCKGKGYVPSTGRKNKMMTDVGGATLQQIANEMGYSIAAATKAIELALQKARFIATMDENDLEIIVLTTINDYINKLGAAAGLSQSDIALMKEHPNIVVELDSFRVFLDRALRKVRKKQPLYNPIA